MTRARLFSALSILVLLTPAAFGQPVLSEIRIDQPSTDNDEYFELAAAPGASLDGFTYLVIGDGSGGSGVIEAVVDLTGSSADANGYFVAAEATFTLGTANLTTNLNFENSDNVTHLLVQGFNGADGDDLDTDDDGVLDVEPWASLTDCVALIETVGSGDLTYCANTAGPDGSFVPAHTLACPGGFDIGAFDPVGGIDTPGADNVCTPQTSARLSEIRIDQPGSDDDEYFELTGTAGEALDGLTYLVVGDGTGGSGVIEAVVDLTATALDANGYFVAAESTFTLGTADLTANLNFENSDNVTHLLVQDFTGADGDDLDTDDDGTLDATPWSLIVDCLALVETVGSGDLTYCPNGNGPDGSFVPGHSILCPSGWQIGDFDPAAGEDTPGAANICTTPTGSLLVINEIDYDQPSTDTAEFLEIKNNDTLPVDLAGYEVQLINGSGGGATPYGTFALPSVTLAPGEYFVLCADSTTVSNCDLQALSSIQNGGPDAVALVLSGTIIDTVSYEGDTAAPYTETTGTGVVDPGSSGEDNLSISRTPDGADTNDNSADFQTVCSTPGAPNSTQTSSCPSVAPPVFVINEIDYDQPGSDTAEFIEIRNNGAGDASLAGFELQLVNGNGGAPYDTIALPATTVTAGGYFVVCADALAVPNCDLEGFTSVQNGSPDAVALVQGATIVDVVSYEGEVAAPYFEGTGAPADSGSTGEDNKGISRTPDGTDTNDNSVDFAFVCVTPGSGNTSETTGCGPAGPVREIFEIQGSGSLSPFDGSTINTLANVVTAVGPEGFFVQTPTSRTDGDLDTSDGIYVFTGSAPSVAVGDLVDISAQVQEFFDFTELVGATVTVVGTEAVPAPVTFDATVPSPDPTAPSCSLEFECYEGMLVTVASGTISSGSQSFNSDPIAEAYAVATTQRAFRETGIEFPGLSGLPVWDGNPELFEIDPDALGLPNQTLYGGSTFQASGAIAFEFGGYELWPTELTVTPAVLPEPVPTRGLNEIGVASLNLFRLFDDVANGSETVLPTTEYQLRLDKTSAYVREVLLAPEVLAVQEVESLVVLQDLAARIADDDPSVVYTGYLVEGNDVGGIDVGFLVRSSITVSAVTQLGAAELLTFDGSLLHDRPPLVLEAITNGYDFQVMALHNRSLGGIDDPSSGPRVRQKRLEQAQSIAQKIQDIQTADPTVRLFVVGDFNAFEFTDGYVDVTGQIRGVVDPSENLLSDIDLVSPDLVNLVDGLPADQRYSFVFRGSAQALDQALVSQEAITDVISFAFGRGNADADELAIESPGALRTSDHDGYVISVLTAPPDSDFDGVIDELDLCPATVIPESVPTQRLGTRRWALVDDDTVFDTRSPGNNPIPTFDTESTGGCSCEQILDALDLPPGFEKVQRRQGCSTNLMQQWVGSIQSP